MPPSRAASETPWTKKLWIYDLRTNKHFTQAALEQFKLIARDLGADVGEGA